jgi:hypothetical protein
MSVYGNMHVTSRPKLEYLPLTGTLNGESATLDYARDADLAAVMALLNYEIECGRECVCLAPVAVL